MREDKVVMGDPTVPTLGETLGMYIARVTPLGREDAAKQLKN